MARITCRFHLRLMSRSTNENAICHDAPSGKNGVILDEVTPFGELEILKNLI
jgi:hypothetical protein